MNSLRFLTGLMAGLALAPAALAQDELTDEPGLSPDALATDAATGGATVIFTNVAGAPASNVPGLAGVVFDPGTGTTDFDRVYGSPNGNWILTCFADLATSEDELLFVNGTLAIQEGQPGPWTGGAENCGTIDTRCSVNDSGDFTFATNTSATVNDDYIVTNIGGAWAFAARELDPIPTLPGNTYDDILDSPLILADGTVGFSADGVDGTVTTTEDDLLILGGTLLLQEGVTVPPGQVGAEFIENYDLSDFFASADGSHWLVQGDLTGPTTGDDVVIVDGAVVLQEDVVIPGSGFPNPVDGGGIVGTYMDAGGNWYARGNNDSSETDWVVRNGAVIAAVGQPIATGSTELWDDTAFSSCYFLQVGDSNGNYVIGGVTDNADPLLNGVIVYNGTTVVCREGDPVDLDGNGAFDDDVFINTFGNDDAFLADDGTLYLVVTVKDLGGSTVGQVFLSMDLSDDVGTNYCAANPNSTGATGVISATGSALASANDLTLIASSLPPGQFGIFVVGTMTDAVPVNAGILCVGGSIGRYQQPGQILQASAAGEFSLSIDVTMIPGPSAFVAANAGDTFYFQAWHRDGLPSAPSSNFTDGLQVDFQ